MDDISVIVHTCDKYNFCWDGWYYYFNKYWNYNLPWKIYFLNETKDINYKNTNQIKSGPGEWSDRLKVGLGKIHSKYIFYLQEDVWLQKKVDFDLFLKLYEIVVKYNINALRIVNKTDPNYYKLNNTSIFNGEISKFKNNSKYLVSHQPSIINKDFLIKTLIPNESPWDNEINGTNRLQNEQIIKYKWGLFKYSGIPDHKIYLFLINNWYSAVVRQGSFTEDGEKLIKNIN